MWSVRRAARRTQTALRPFDATRSARTRKLPEKWERTGAASGKKPGELRALRVAEIVDLRRTQGRKHSAASVFGTYMLAWPAGFREPVAAADYAKPLTQEECARKNKKTELYEAVSNPCHLPQGFRQRRAPLDRQKGVEAILLP